MRRNRLYRFICVVLIMLLTLTAFPAYADDENASSDTSAESGTDETNELPDPEDPTYDVEISSGNLVVKIKNNQAYLAWDEPTVSITDTATGEIREDYTVNYGIYRRMGPNSFIRIAETEKRSYIDKTIKAEKIYRYYVLSEITFNDEKYTEKSNVKRNLFFVKDVGPIKYLKTRQKKNKAAVTLRWNRAKNAKKFIIYRRRTGRGWVRLKTTRKTRYIDNGVVFTHKYYYKVKGIRTFKGRTKSTGFFKSRKIRIKKPLVFKLHVKNINQYKIGYNMGCEIVSLAIVMLFYAFTPRGGKAMTDTLFYKWTKRGNYNLYKAHYGNPHGHGSFGACYETVIRDTANKFLKHKKSKLRAVALRGKKLSTLCDHLLKGRPVIVWATERMVASRNYRMSAGIWNVNAHTIVLTGYNKKKGLIYVADPERGNVAYKRSTFYSRYSLRGKRAVVIY